MKQLDTYPVSVFTTILVSVLFLTGISNRYAAQCTASFNYTTGPNGQIIVTSMATPINSTSILSWTMAGATPSVTTGATANVTYSANGVYTVYHQHTTVVPPCTSPVFTMTVSVSNVCVVNASFNWTVGANGLVTFAASGAISYTWNTGAIGATMQQQFPSNGNYTVVLLASNGMCTDTITNVVHVNTVCNLTADFATTQTGQGMVAFQNLTSGASGSATYQWNFGDGTTSNLFSPLHTYSANGTYPVTLTVTDGFCFSQDTMSIVVNTYTCSAGFQYALFPAGVVQLTSTSVPLDTSNQLSWSFPGGVVQGSIAVAAFSIGGLQPIMHKINTVTNCEDSTTLFILPCMLNVGFSYTQAGNTATFSSTSSGPTGKTKYVWSFGDNNSDTTAIAVHQFSANGLYTVTLVVTDSLCSGSFTQVININSIAPCQLQAGFSHTVGPGGNVTFNAIAFSGETIGRTFWDFGDGYTGTGVSEFHQYGSAGLYYVRLAASALADSMCVDTVIQAINITGPDCIADSYFLLSADDAVNSWIIIPNSPWNIVKAAWSWGDGNSASTLFAAHQYSEPGSYEICLTVTASCGASSSYCKWYSFAHAPGSAGSLFINVLRPEPTGIADSPADDALVVYPNPASDRICFSDQFDEGARVEILNGQGSLLFAQRITGRDCVTGLDFLEPGMYVARIISPYRNTSVRFVILRRS